MVIHTDHSENVYIYMNMYIQEDITIYHYHYNVETTCGYHQDKRYVRFPTNHILDPDEILELAQDEYDTNKLPCEDIRIECTGNNTDFERE